MILNIFSLTISITKQPSSTEKALEYEYSQKILKENQRKIEHYCRIRQY